MFGESHKQVIYYYAEAEACALDVSRLLNGGEGFEDSFKVFFPDADAFVGDLNLD